MSSSFEQQTISNTASFYPATGAIPVATQGATVFRSAEAEHVDHRHSKPSGSSSSSAELVTGTATNFGFSAQQQVPYYSTGLPGGITCTTSAGSFGTVASGPRRKGQRRQEVHRLPDQGQPCVRQVRHRLLTPEPDVIEKVYIQRAAAEIVEEITEIPTTPPPIVQERNVTEPSGPAKVIRKTIRVPPRGTQTIAAPVSVAAPLNCTAMNYNPSAASGFGGYFSGGLTGGATSLGGFGSFGGGFQQPNFGFGGYQQPSFGFGGSQQSGFGYGGFQSAGTFPSFGQAGGSSFFC